MERFLCVHGHFYQPPRENPWLEAIELQDSAHPYHDWNERITAECYAPNAAARVLDGSGKITDISSNYARMSFDFGPTVLSWMETKAPETYRAIIEADRQNAVQRAGHGNAMAQAYNHIIMPLAAPKDKRTQVVWGISDFLRRFGRKPEGMWLPETAVDLETIDLLAEYGIRYTVLAPRQAARVRKIGTGKWKDVSGSRIDPTRPYLCRLPSGRSLTIFFYDEPISHAIAFERLLSNGEDFVKRILDGFSDSRPWPQIVSIATDGETYGHHQKFGDMALSYALTSIESQGLARLTNFGEYLERYPASHEVEIFENSSWSCVHGIERWRDNCGCNSGGHAGWNQAWRKPLREVLDRLRDKLLSRYENGARNYLSDPWQARNDYINLMLDRSPENRQGFFLTHATHQLSPDEEQAAIRLLEMERHAMLMHTSCGWFFDEISGIETVQVLHYAARAVQLCEESLGCGLEDALVTGLASAGSNLPDMGNGAAIYDRFVRPSVIDLKKVGVHYAVSSMFEDYPEATNIFCYAVSRETYERHQTGDIRLAIGRVRVVSDIICTGDILTFAVIHFGHHALNCGIGSFPSPDAYEKMRQEMLSAFEKEDFADIIRLMDKHFGMNNYSFGDLFRDEQRKILTLVTGQSVSAMTDAYRDMYAEHSGLMEFLRGTGMPVPQAFMRAAEFTLNHELRTAFARSDLTAERLGSLLNDIRKWGIAIDLDAAEFAIRRQLEQMMEEFAASPLDIERLDRTATTVELLGLLPMTVNLWHVQNIYHQLVKTAYADTNRGSQADEEGSRRWTAAFRKLGDMLNFNTAVILAGDMGGVS
jgi:alpha-amylase/alpha-mannosidase (GH57 family)